MAKKQQGNRQGQAMGSTSGWKIKRGEKKAYLIKWQLLSETTSNIVCTKAYTATTLLAGHELWQDPTWQPGWQAGNQPTGKANNAKKATILWQLLLLLPLLLHFVIVSCCLSLAASLLLATPAFCIANGQLILTWACAQRTVEYLAYISVPAWWEEMMLCKTCTYCKFAWIMWLERGSWAGYYGKS